MIQMWAKAEDDTLYPMPSQEHRALIEDIWGMTESIDFNSSEEHIDAIYDEFNKKIIQEHGEYLCSTDDKMAEDYITALCLDNFCKEGDLGGRIQSDSDTCEKCGCSEFLCGHNGSDVSDDSDMSECETCGKEVDKDDLETAQDPMSSDDDDTLQVCEECRTPEEIVRATKTIKVPLMDVTNVSEYGYCKKNKCLYIVMTGEDGGEYEYKDVPEHIFEDMKKATSIGSYLHRYVRGRYRYAKVS